MSQAVSPALTVRVLLRPPSRRVRCRSWSGRNVRSLALCTCWCHTHIHTHRHRHTQFTHNRSHTAGHRQVREGGDSNPLSDSKGVLLHALPLKHMRHETVRAASPTNCIYTHVCGVSPCSSPVRWMLSQWAPASQSSQTPHSSHLYPAQHTPPAHTTGTTGSQHIRQTGKGTEEGYMYRLCRLCAVWPGKRRVQGPTYALHASSPAVCLGAIIPLCSPLTCLARAGDMGGTLSCRRHSLRQIWSGTKSARAPMN